MYRINGTLNVFDQLTLARKLSPALGVVDGLLRKENQSKDKTLLTVLLLGQLSDLESDFVVRKCLSTVVRVQDGGVVAPVLSPEGLLMFDDIDMRTVLGLVDQVIEANLGDFLRTALSGLKPQTGSAVTSQA